MRDNSHQKENSEKENNQCDERKAQLEVGKKNLPVKQAEQYKVFNEIMSRWLAQCNSANM